MASKTPVEPFIKSISVKDNLGNARIGRAGEQVTITINLSEAIDATNMGSAINGSSLKPSFTADGLASSLLTEVGFLGYDARKKSLSFSAKLPDIVDLETSRISLLGLSLGPNLSLTGVSSKLTLSTANLVAAPYVSAPYVMDNLAPVWADSSIIPITENARAGLVYSAKLNASSAGVSFRLAPSADSSFFNINSKTGQLSLKASANYEAHPSDYQLTLWASDAAGNSAAKSISVPILDVPENIRLASTAKGVGVLSAVKGRSNVSFDISADFVDPDQRAISYHLLNTLSGLTIDTASGVLSLATVPDSLLQFTVQASDSQSSHVTRVYRISPIKNFSVQSMTVTDREAGGSSLVGKSGNTVNISLQLSEPLSGASLSASNFVPVFTVGKGSLSNLSSPVLSDDKTSISFSAELPSGARVEGNRVILKSLSLGESWSGSYSASPLQYNARKPLAANYILDNSAPVMTATARKSINENIGSNQLVFSPSARDASPLSYSLMNSGDAGSFSINPSTGRVNLIANPNFENKSIYNFTIIATDAVGNSTSQAVSLSVKNLKEAPQLLNLPQGKTSAVLNQAQALGVSVAEPDDLVGNSQILSLQVQPYSGALRWNGEANQSMPSYASINNTTGVLTIRSSTTLMNSALAKFQFIPNDFSGNQSAQLKYTLTDPNKLTTQATVTYQVLSEPQIEHVMFSDNQGNAAAGKAGALAQLAIRLNEAISLTGNALTVQGTFGGGAQEIPLSASFASHAVISSQGNQKSVLYFDVTLPSGDANYVLLTALNIGAQTTLLGNLTGQPLNSLSNLTWRNAYLLDNQAPSISSSNTLSVAENQTRVGNLSASESVTWSLSGTDASLFSLQENSATLQFLSSKNFELDKSSYSLTVTATDLAGNTTQQALTVQLSDVNEPVTARAGIGSQSFVVNLSGSQIDAWSDFTDPENQLTYSVTGNPAWLTLNSATGVLSGTPTTASNFTITVTARDDNNSSASRTYSVTVVNTPVIQFAAGQDLYLNQAEDLLGLSLKYGFETGNVVQMKKANVVNGTEGSKSNLGSAVTITENNHVLSIAVNKSDFSGDGEYRIYAEYITAGANPVTLSSEPQRIVVDTVLSPGTLGLVDFQDSGSSTTDRISQDKNFSLALKVNETAEISYQRSGDNTLWTDTVAQQSHVPDGRYYYRALVTDLAGNSVYISLANPLTVDSTAPSLVAPAALNNDGHEKILAGFTLSNVGGSASESLTLKISVSNGTLTGVVDQNPSTPEIDITASASELQTTLNSMKFRGLADGDANLQFSLSDTAGNSSSALLPITVRFPLAAGFMITGTGNLETFVSQTVSTAGDINGDGLADLMIASPKGLDSTSTAGSGYGRVYVVFGKANTNVVTPSNLADGTAGFIIYASSHTVALDNVEYAKISLSAVGDMNGDGLADMVIGQPYQDKAGTTDNSGRSYVVFGKTSNSAIQLSEIETGNSTQGFMLQGGASAELSGASVSAAGDINGDGLADILIGAPIKLIAGVSTGGAYVVYGKSSGGTVELSAIAGSSLGFQINGVSDSQNLGRSVAPAGDVNGDGYADLIVGNNNANLSGCGYVVFGRALNSDIQLSQIQAGSSSLGFVINSAGADNSTFCVAGAGDVNGDGLSDVMVSANFALQSRAPGATYRSGRAYVVFGKTDGTPVELSGLESAAPSGGFLMIGPDSTNTPAQFGHSLSGAGDVNGDGLADLIIGADGKDKHQGACYIVFGKTDTAALSMNSLSTRGFSITGVTSFPNLGVSVSAAGDVNGDGLADLIFGATIDGDYSAGRAYVMFGKTDSNPVDLVDIQNGFGVALDVDFTGTASANSWTGGSGDQIALGGAGNDVLTGGGGADVLLGGDGNDVLVVNASNIAALSNGPVARGLRGHMQLARLDGGGDIDTLRLSAGSDLNLTQISNSALGASKFVSRISSIEKIDMATDTNSNTLTLAALDVVDMAGINLYNTGNGWSNTSGTALGASVFKHQLQILGTGSDKVDIDTHVWTQVDQASVSDGTHQYQVWNHNTVAAQLLIQQNVAVI